MNRLVCVLSAAVCCVIAFAVSMPLAAEQSSAPSQQMPTPEQERAARLELAKQAGRAFSAANSAAGRGPLGKVVSVAKNASLTEAPALFVLLIVAVGAGFYRIAQRAQRGVSLRFASVVLGIVLFVALVRVSEEWFLIWVPYAEDGSWSVPLYILLALALPPLLVVVLLGLGWRHGLRRWRWLGGTPVVRTSSAWAGPQRNRTLGIGLLAFAAGVALFRFLLVEPLFRGTSDAMSASFSLKSDLQQVELLTTMVTVQASMDVVAVVSALAGIVLWWRNRSA